MEQVLGSLSAYAGAAPADKDWWRPRPAVETADTITAAPVETSGSRLAFRALIAFTLILLLSPQIYFPILGTMRIALLAAGLAIAAHVMDRLVTQQPITSSSRELTLAMLLVGWSTITIPVSYWPGGSVGVLTDVYLKAVAFFWLIGTVLFNVQRVRMFCWTLIICSVPLALTGIGNYLDGATLTTGVTGFERIAGYVGGSGLVGNPNDLALMLNLIIPIAGGLALSETRRLPRYFAIGAMLLSAVTVILTFSRAGFLALATTFVVFLVSLMRQGRSVGGAIALLVGALIVVPFLPQGYTDRLSTITDIEADKTGSAEGRWRDFQVALGVVAANPVVGVGLGQDILAMNEQRGEDWTAVHNAYLQSAVDLGIPGLLLFAWLHVSCYRTARRVERACEATPSLADLGNIATGARIALMTFVVAAFFHPIAYQFYFFTVAGLAVALTHAYDTATC